jgi:hypothetical protein
MKVFPYFLPALSGIQIKSFLRVIYVASPALHISLLARNRKDFREKILI